VRFLQHRSLAGRSIARTLGDCYVLPEQSERQRGVRLTIDDVFDAGDSDSNERQGMKMISDSQVYVLNAGESVVLECYFTAAKYNMFDYPLLWKKVLSFSRPGANADHDSIA